MHIRDEQPNAIHGGSILQTTIRLSGLFLRGVSSARIWAASGVGTCLDWLFDLEQLGSLNIANSCIFVITHFMEQHLQEGICFPNSYPS
jgi:hypothetical protein